MGLFGKKKKKSSTSNTFYSETSKESGSENGPLSMRAAAFSKVFSVKSFRSPRHKGFPGLPISPISLTEEAGETENDLENADSGDGPHSEEKVHHSVKKLPPLSPAMAAIQARTMELQQKQDAENVGEATPVNISDGNAFPDRPEKKRSVRGPAAVKARKAQESPALSEHWLISLDNLELGKTIGHSSFGAVNEGRLNGTKVAVKTIQLDSSPNSPNSVSAFKKEAELNCKLRHPNIVLFMGISVQPEKISIVTELMARGNVRDLLVGLAKGGGQIRLDWSLRQQWALDTAQGMAYLHSLDPPMIHRDLKTTNLLVDRGMNVKICDFGLSRFKTDKLMSAVGTVHFAAPEVLRHERYTEKADLFSFGTVLWEFYTRQCVFKGLPQIEVYNAVIEGNMPAVDDGVDERYESLMKECWATDPKQRPSFRTVIDRLSTLVDELDES